MGPHHEGTESHIRCSVDFGWGKARHLGSEGSCPDPCPQELPEALRSPSLELVCMKADGDDAARHPPRAPHLLRDTDDALMPEREERYAVRDCAEAARLERAQRVSVEGVVGRHKVGAQQPMPVEDPGPGVDGAHLFREGAPCKLRHLLNSVPRPDQLKPWPGRERVLVAVLRHLNCPFVPQLPHRCPKVCARRLPVQRRVSVVGHDAEQGLDLVAPQEREGSPEPAPVHGRGYVVHAEDIARAAHAALCR